MPERLASNEESYKSKEMAAKIETLFVVNGLLKLKLHPKEKSCVLGLIGLSRVLFFIFSYPLACSFCHYYPLSLLSLLSFLRVSNLSFFHRFDSSVPEDIYQHHGG